MKTWQTMKKRLPRIQVIQFNGSDDFKVFDHLSYDGSRPTKIQVVKSQENFNIELELHFSDRPTIRIWQGQYLVLDEAGDLHVATEEELRAKWEDD